MSRTSSGCSRRELGFLSKFVDVAGIFADSVEQFALVAVERQLALRHNRTSPAAETEILENIRTVAHQPRPIAEQCVRALGGLGEDAPGNDKHLAPLVGSK